MSDRKGGGVSMHGCESNCCSSRSFLTRDEKVEMLEEYKSQLESEAKGVAERIKELKKQN